jgi:hypothetical protein
MLAYKTDVNSTQKWQTTSILYTFSSSYNSSAFAGRLFADGNSITGNGDGAKWKAAIDAVKAVSSVPLSETTNPALATLGLLSGTVNGTSTGLGYRDPNSITASNITYGLGIIEGNQSSYLYIHELLHTLGLNHPGNVEGDDPAFKHYTVDSTVMRYGSANDEYVLGKKIVTPMVYDIALLQQKYGVNYGDLGQDYVVQVDDYGSPASIASTLWLGGGRGENHIDAKDVNSVDYTSELETEDGRFYNKIDLRGGFETVDGKLLPRFSQVGQEVFSLALDPGTNNTWEKSIVVENATGSLLAPNMLIGNAAKNELIGGNQQDTIIGGGGESLGDLLKGNDGKDILIADNAEAKRRFNIKFEDDAANDNNILTFHKKLFDVA